MNERDVYCRKVRYRDLVTLRTFVQTEELWQEQLESISCDWTGRNRCASGRHPVQRLGSWLEPNPWRKP